MKLIGTFWACLILASASLADTYKAESGDSIERIAHKLGVSVDKIKDLNPGLTDEKLKVGMAIHIPGGKSTKKPSNGQYWVRNGETAQSIAHLYGISEGQLRKLNEGTKIKTGACINVPFADTSAKQIHAALAAKVKTPAVASGGLYVVEAGDNDWTIAAKYHTTAHLLRELNSGIDFEKLKVGANIRIPAAKIAQKPAGKVALATKPKADPKVEKKTETKADATTAAIEPVINSDDTVALENPISVSQKPSGGTFQLQEPVEPVKVVKSDKADRKISTRSAKVKGDSVNMRFHPSTSADRVAQVDAGSVGKVLDNKDGWVKLQFANGDKGWIRADFLTPSSEAVVAVHKPAALPKVSRGGGASSKDIALLHNAYSFLGVRYVYGGTSRSGIDCSGFTGAVYRSLGVSLPRTAAEQAGMGHYVSRSELQRGDLVFFRTGRSERINHVAIYIGGGKIIHASSGGGQVRTDELSKPYYSNHYATARRIRNFDRLANNYEPNDIAESPARDVSFPLPDTEVPETPVRSGADPIGK